MNAIIQTESQSEIIMRVEGLRGLEVQASEALRRVDYCAPSYGEASRGDLRKALGAISEQLAALDCALFNLGFRS